MLSPENSEYTITHENEIAYILSKFDDDFVYNTVDESINNIFKYFTFRLMPNIPMGYETNFRCLLVDYPDSSHEILEKRNEVYRNILKILCDRYQIAYEDYDDNRFNLATSVFYMYHLLVSGFIYTAIDFFVNYIIKEKEGLYRSLDLDEQKKNKDISTIYSKKVFENPKLGIICSNIETVIKNICEMDIPLNTYISVSYGNDPIVQYLNSVISPTNDFFKTYIKPIIYGDNAISFITEVRLRLLNYNTVNLDTLDLMKNFKPLEED